MDKKEVKSIADTEVRKHEKSMHKGSKPTKMAKGGKTQDAMKAVGRNMAKLKNQFGKFMFNLT